MENEPFTCSLVYSKLAAGLVVQRAETLSTDRLYTARSGRVGSRRSDPRYSKLRGEHKDVIRWRNRVGDVPISPKVCWLEVLQLEELLKVRWCQGSNGKK